ncbi:ArsR/SmtB family transcription factor [Aeromicrobium ginsengisoli]|uniref:Helix-turn-helix transcriptional regulator n=1 Tax=Aeromicrobium ginsengisoli TaxID=363867 RepID=A0A5M4FB82_9ACTN|nr:metalloregulator ArsR/SmtB family transcription factor [Aeromicrobium ginsengisoli]KAA1395623.1 helix-turn-helix transcriptional regulator [Aeromicrobium ginsengisoli]
MATDQLSKVFSALADPTRRDILTRLGQGDATVSELADPFPISLPAISRHLKVLETAGLISRDKRAQWRTNSLEAAPLKEATTWMEHLSHVWDDRFDRLDAHLAAMKALQGTTDTDKEEEPNDD